MSEANIAGVIMVYTDHTESEKMSYDNVVNTLNNIYAIKVVDSNGVESDEYKFVLWPDKLKRVDGGIEIEFKRNLLDIKSIIWIDETGTVKEETNIGNVTKYTICEEGIIKNVYIELSNSEHVSYDTEGLYYQEGGN